MRLTILLLIGFGSGIAGGTWLAVRNAPPPEPAAPADTATSSVRPADAAGGFSGAEPPLDTAALVAAGVDSGQSTATPVAAVTVEPVPPRPPAPVPTGPTPAEIDAAQRSLARIFAQMDAVQAADVLQHMSDDEVESVMRRLGTRQAAELMAVLPKSRAANLARRLMVPKETGQ